MNKNKNTILSMVFSALCLALCMVLPFLTGQIPQIGAMLSPMHIPVLILGFWAGPLWASIVGFVAPLLRFMLFGMPPILPNGIAMAFELATYGLVSGFLYRKLGDSTFSIYASLIGAMICGRVVWGVARLVISGIQHTSFTFAAFIAGALTSAIPGIILHIILVPLVVAALKKSGLIIKG